MMSGFTGVATGFTILVAEDAQAVRAYVGKVLEAQGHTVLAAVDGVEALEVAAQHPWPIHLLLTDLAMPRLDGCELHRALKRQHPETRTLFMSGFFVTALPPGTSFLPKPLLARALVQRVGEMLRPYMQRSTALRSAQRV
jgi:hypothetical protein